MPVSAMDAAYVRDLVRRRSAITLGDDKTYLIESRLATVATERGLGSIEDLIARARAGSAELDTSIIEAITTHETSFFRDVAPYDTLRKTVLPPIIAARRAQRTLRIWSAACSSGQEPLSIAMTVLEHFPELRDWSFQIVATDLSSRVLQRAREARFGQIEVNRGMPAALLMKYFDRAGMHWTARQELRSRIEYRQLNLIEPWTMQPAPDIVFLRNVLIYFEPPVKRTILKRVRENIAAGGCLFLGGAETTFNVSDEWEPVRDGGATFYRGR